MLGSVHLRRAGFVLALAFSASGCAGGGTQPPVGTTNASADNASRVIASGGGSTGGGGATGGGGTSGGGGAAGGGGVTTAPGTNPLSPTAPAPGVFLRESFGFGPDSVRPTGDKGVLRAIFGGTGLSGFWVEYPDSKAVQWTAQNWNFAGGSVDSFETLPTPLQPTFNGVTISDWRDGILTTGDAIAPIAPPHAKWTVSTDAMTPDLPGSYLGFGVTTSPALQNNLSASGDLWIRFIADQPLGAGAHYDVLSGSRVLASGTTLELNYVPLSITVDPATGTASASVNGTAVGTWPIVVTSRFVALEGQGVANNVVGRTTP